jgi:hypothetical protein
VFHTKTKAEQAQETLEANRASLASSAASAAEHLRERVVPAVEQAAGSAMEWGQPRVEAARHWAKPHVEHGIEVAAPRLESAVSALAPKVDTARDKIVDDLLPRLTEAIGAFADASAAAKDEAVSRGAGAAAVLSGDAVASRRCHKKGKVLLTLGLLAGGAAAAVAAFLKKSAPKDDPWATPLASPSVATTPGRHSRVEPVDEAIGLVDDAESEPEILEALDEADVPDPLDGADPAEKDGTDETPRA